MEANVSKQSGASVPRVFRVLAIVVAILPWLGIAVRMLTANERYLTIVGCCFWLSGVAVFLVLHKSFTGQTRWNFPASVMVFTFTFVPLYVVCVLATGHFLSKS
jgi:heme/copper-type cytochrome/quinol oxidase subunit 4